MEKVNLFFVGTAKSSTTSLFKTLENSNDFNLPIIKEPNYFSLGSANVPGYGQGDEYATEQIKDIKAYETNYANDSRRKYKCDFSVSYLYDDIAPELIHRYNNNAKVIIILRNPTFRAWSHYLHLVRDFREREPFKDALDLEDSRISEGYEFSWHYKKMGLYYEQVKRYKALFGDNAKIFVYENIFEDQSEFFNKLADFLDISSLKNCRFSSTKFNSTGSIKHKRLARVLNKPTRARSFVRKIIPRKIGTRVMEILRKSTMDGDKPEIPPESMRLLNQYYENEIERLEIEFGLDLQIWKEKY